MALALTIAFTHDRLILSEGRISDQTRAVRTEFSVPDPAATQRARDGRSLLTPGVYTIDQSVRLELESSLRAAPAALAAAETLDDVTDDIRAAFRLTLEQLDAIRTQAEAHTWASQVTALMSSLVERPLLSSDEFQRALEDPAPRLDLRVGDEEPITVVKSRALNVEGDLDEPLRRLVRGAGFRGDLLEVVLQRLTTSPKPMFVFDRGATETKRAEA
ncbi:MAG: hypothetical protein IID31_12970, partial [Planctomycetes bacterium]|nr:hypothetical protein [Planctomycetota bacterium]